MFPGVTEALGAILKRVADFFDLFDRAEAKEAAREASEAARSLAGEASVV